MTKIYLITPSNANTTCQTHSSTLPRLHLTRWGSYLQQTLSYPSNARRRGCSASCRDCYSCHNLDVILLYTFSLLCGAFVWLSRLSAML